MLMLGIGVVLEFLVRARVRVKVTARVRESGGTKRLGTVR